MRAATPTVTPVIEITVMKLMKAPLFRAKRYLFAIKSGSLIPPGGA